MPPKLPAKGHNAIYPRRPARKVTIQDYDDIAEDEQKEEDDVDDVDLHDHRLPTQPPTFSPSNPGANHIVFQTKPKAKPAAEIGDISTLGLGFDGKDYDFSGLMKLIMNNMLVAESARLSQDPFISTSTFSEIESALRIIILPNEIVGMATSDAKYVAVVVRFAQARSSGKGKGKASAASFGGEGEEQPFVKILEGYASPTFGQALQSLLFRSVAAVASFVELEGKDGERDMMQ